MIAKLAFEVEDGVGIFEATVRPSDDDLADDERLIVATVRALPEEAVE